MLYLYITGGLFLGWSLGANDAANVFGNAVGSRMISFKKAAILCSIFVIIGAVVQGAGASETITKLGNIDLLYGSFAVTLSAAISVYAMSYFGLPVSTSQVVVGGIIGWNLFVGQSTDSNSLTEIIYAWLYSPLLGGIFSVLLYMLIRYILNVGKFHLLKRDAFLRYALIIAGIIGSYSLGANNIANVMGVFIKSIPLKSITIFNSFVISGPQQLFFIGGLAIALGVLTYSKKTMKTIGNGVFKLNTEASLAVVLSHSIVLFLFSSLSLKMFLINHGMPSFPLVPVSSSQTIVGAIIGIGLFKNAYNIKYSLLGWIGLGWIISPIIAAMLSFILLFLLK